MKKKNDNNSLRLKECKVKIFESDNKQKFEKEVNDFYKKLVKDTKNDWTISELVSMPIYDQNKKKIVYTGKILYRVYY